MIQNNKNKQKLPISREISDQIVSQYESGVGTQQIAQTFNLHPSTIQKHIKKQGILKPKNQYTHNAAFFSTYTPESVYWAGFIMADGYVRTNRHMVGIHLQERDKEHLRMFLQVVKSSHNLLHDTCSDAWCVQIYSKQLKFDLLTNFNVTPQKSKTATFPLQIPKEYYHHFIRGIIDGDGCITYTTVPTLSLVGTNPLLTTVNGIISNNTSLLHYPKICTPISSKLWFSSLSFYGKNAKIVLDWIYKDSTNSTRLDRKYKLYCDLFVNADNQ